jgi:hypothetical protein
MVQFSRLEDTEAQEAETLRQNTTNTRKEVQQLQETFFVARAEEEQTVEAQSSKMEEMMKTQAELTQQQETHQRDKQVYEQLTKQASLASSNVETLTNTIGEVKTTALQHEQQDQSRNEHLNLTAHAEQLGSSMARLKTEWKSQSEELLNTQKEKVGILKTKLGALLFHFMYRFVPCVSCT